MDDVLYRQDPLLSPEKYTLGRTYLCICSSWGMGAQTLRLSQISPEYRPIKRRFKGLYVFPFSAFALSCEAGLWLIIGTESRLCDIIGITLIIQAPFLLLQARFAAVEGVRFVDTAGQTLFDIYRPFKNVFKYDEFIKELVRRILENQRSGA